MMKNISRKQLKLIVREMVMENLNSAPPPEPVLNKSDLLEEDPIASADDLVARIKELLSRYAAGRERNLNGSPETDDII